MRLSLLLIVASFACVIEATSDADPDYVYLCDAHSPLWGCDPSMWIDNDRLKCRNTSQIMNWASKPVRSNCYRITAGSEASPATEYMPNEYIHIHVRVHCWKMLYRGLLIYAVDESERRVGDWYLPFDEPALYHAPWKDPNHACYRTIMHASADLKPYHSVLHFKAPPVGTGRITFRALIKQGDANTGAFYWPMMSDLSLSEGRAKEPTIQWYKSAVGQSCNELCPTIGKGYACVESAFELLSSKQAVQEQLLGTYPCKLPLLSGCSVDGASFDPVNEFCYYNELNCVNMNRTASSVNCDSKHSELQRFCPCQMDGLNVDVDDEMSAAVPLQKSVVTSALLMLVSMLMFNKKETVVMLCISLLLIFGVSPISAHNWVNSNSRANGASAYQPCKPPITDIPHAQVGPGQAFQIEWMNGHGAYTYFAIMHSKNLDKMKLNTFALLDDYIRRAPNGSNVANQPQYMKYHRKETPTLDNDRPDTRIANFFEDVIPMNDPRFIYRPPSFGGRIGTISRPKDTDVTYMFTYKPNERKNDIRVSYQSDLYPWLEAVYKFQVVALHPNRPDTANFYIPGYGGPGRYVIQYLWRGYRDCVDVDYKLTPVDQIYGYALNFTRWTRIDHCLFENPRNVYDVSEIVTDPQYCLDRCESRGTNCYGVNVVPLMAPPSVYQHFEAPPDKKWMYPHVYGADIYTPWNNTAFNETKELFMSNPTPNKYLCYTVRPAEFTDTQDDFTVSSDPEDPIFYSTCYYKLLGNMFDDYLNGSKETTRFVPWRFNDKCIDCKTRSVNSDNSVTPKWPLSDTCVNCDREPDNTPKPLHPSLYLIENGTRCDGMGGAWGRSTHHSCSDETLGNCVKQLIPVGRTPSRDVTPEECYALAARDPECSDFMIMVRSNRCHCYTKQACCNTCSRRPDSFAAVYSLTNTPDPDCSTGVLSADSTACCSASCGANGCIPNNSTINAVGFCCSTCITRPCSQYGPPCRMV